MGLLRDASTQTGHWRDTDRTIETSLRLAFLRLGRFFATAACHGMVHDKRPWRKIDPASRRLTARRFR